LALTVLIASGATGLGAQEPPPPQASEFLASLAGDWSVVSEAKLGPGQDPVRIESRESARLIGGRWLVAESTGSAGGASFTSILTLGYDPADGHFIGTWISGRQAHMWTYTGELHETGTRLTLNTEGPVMGNPDKTAEYREVIEILGPNRRVTRSLILGPDGSWFQFQRAEYQRSESADSGASPDRLDPRGEEEHR